MNQPSSPRIAILSSSWHRDIVTSSTEAAKAEFEARRVELEKIAGEKLAADIGTALHLATEHADLATDARPPDPWLADIVAYLHAGAK